jgi:hypothetical protein
LIAGLAVCGLDPAEDRDDGTKNIGFRDLKGTQQGILSIAEIQDRPALRDTLLVLNASGYAEMLCAGALLSF